MTSFELMHVSNTACSLVTFLLNVVLNVAAWLIVLTTVDRFVAVWLPLHAAVVCRRRRARLAVCALVVVTVAASVHLFWTTGLYESPDRALPYCGPPLDARFMRHQFEYIKLASYSLAPFAIILALNIAIVVRLRSPATAALLQRCATDHTGSLHQPAVTSRVTYMLLAVSATWLILSAPFTLQTLIGARLVDVSNERSVARYLLLRTVCFQLMYANHAVNFFLYCVTGRKFRHELRDMYVELCCWCPDSYDRRRIGGGVGATRVCGNNVEQDLTPEALLSTRRGQTGQELMVITTCRSSHGSLLVAQSRTAAQYADTSL